MLGSFELEGIEAIDSFERRALVEHRVPGLAGSYFQDLGTAPNTIVISGTRHGDDARVLAGYRALYQDFEDGSGRDRFEWNITMHGPVMAFSIQF